MKKILIILAICFFKLLPFPVYAEGIQFDHVMNLGVQITGIVQDEDGFFWIATSNGLKRYDGLEIRKRPGLLQPLLGIGGHGRGGDRKGSDLRIQ